MPNVLEFAGVHFHSPHIAWAQQQQQQGHQQVVNSVFDERSSAQAVFECGYSAYAVYGIAKDSVQRSESWAPTSKIG